MKVRVLFGGVIAAAFVVAGMAGAAESKKDFKATCVVSGKPAKEANFVEHDGKKVYFCCKNCLKKFKNAPAKFKAEKNLQLLQTGQMIQVGCPFSGKPVDEKTLVKFQGTEFGFCCNKCKAKFEKADDAKKLEMVFAKIDKSFTLQTKCPISGKPIDIETSIVHDGKTVYFCCPGCDKKYKANPAKYKGKLKI